MTKYRKKPVVVEAVQLLNTYDSIKECIEFTRGTKINGDNDPKEEYRLHMYANIIRTEGGINISTLEGDMKASFGDFIIKGVNREFYPCKPDIFEKTYEEVKN